MKLLCSSAIIQESLSILLAAGARGHEGIVLWLGDRDCVGRPEISECYVPDHVADFDYFKISESSMKALNKYLRFNRLRIVAQVHSHPGRAYHSETDDEWTIVRYEGALSFVVPSFARRTTKDNFLDLVAVYQLSADDLWSEAIAREVMEIEE